MYYQSRYYGYKIAQLKISLKNKKKTTINPRIVSIKTQVYIRHLFTDHIIRIWHPHFKFQPDFKKKTTFTVQPNLK